MLAIYTKIAEFSHEKYTYKPKPERYNITTGATFLKRTYKELTKLIQLSSLDVAFPSHNIDCETNHVNLKTNLV